MVLWVTPFQRSSGRIMIEQANGLQNEKKEETYKKLF